MVKQFIISISHGLEGVMNDSAMQLMLDLTHEHFYDEMTDLAKSEPTRLDHTLAAHFVTKFVLDFLQFGSAHLITAKPHNTKPTAARQLYDHRAPVDIDFDGAGSASLKLSYVIPNFEEVMKACVESLAKIWPNQQNILRFWCIKHAENPRKSTEVDEEKDSYDR